MLLSYYRRRGRRDFVPRFYCSERRPLQTAPGHADLHRLRFSHLRRTLLRVRTAGLHWSRPTEVKHAPWSLCAGEQDGLSPRWRSAGLCGPLTPPLSHTGADQDTRLRLCGCAYVCIYARARWCMSAHVYDHEGLYWTMHGRVHVFYVCTAICAFRCVGVRTYACLHVYACTGVQG